MEDFGIEISNKTKEPVLLCFSSKAELKNNNYFQSILEQFYNNEDTPVIKCSCNDVDMICKHKNYYFFSNLPNNSHKHKFNCIYHAQLEITIDSDGRFRPLIFKKPTMTTSTPALKDFREFSEKNNQRANTYNTFCLNMISETNAKSFNLKNRNVLARENIQNITISDFIEVFDDISNNNSLLEKGSIKDSLAPYYMFDYGFISDADLTSKKGTEKEHKITLEIVSKNWKKESNKRIFDGYGRKNKEFIVNDKLLENSLNLVKSFDNYISAPYFFMCVSKYNKDKRIEMVRLFLHPVAIYKEHLAFVDSNYERIYAEHLIENSVPFIKPVLHGCFYKIGKKFVNYTRENGDEKRAFLQYLPDFIEFEKEHIQIVEVSGYDNEDYQNLMNRKIEHYKKESVKSKGLYQSKIIVGKDLIK